jgi:MFS family permease
MTGLNAPFVYVAPFAEDVLRTSTGHAFTALSAMNAGSLIGRPIPGLIADAAGSYNVLIGTTALSGAVILALWTTAHAFGALVAFAVLYGVASGAVIALRPPCVAAIAPPDQIGTYVGLTYAMLSFPYVRFAMRRACTTSDHGSRSSLVGSPIAGAILSRQHGSYTGLIAFSGTTMIVGAAITTIVKLQLVSRPFAKV